MEGDWTEIAPIWGLRRWEMTFDDQRWWKTQIENPFFKDGRWTFTLNKKFLSEARICEVNKIIVILGDEETGKEIMMDVPSERYIKNKEKEKQYKDKPSMFKDSRPMRLYYFYVNQRA